MDRRWPPAADGDSEPPARSRHPAVNDCIRLALSGAISECPGWLPVFGRGKPPSHDRARCRLTACPLPPHRVVVGTSGYNYPEWRGTFYPEKFSTAKMLAGLCRALQHSRDQLHLLPDADREARSAGWPPGRLTLSVHAEGAAANHARREAAAVRGSPPVVLPHRPRPRAKLGDLLFQLPPTFKKDVEVFARFSSCCPTEPGRRSSSGTRPGSTRKSSTPAGEEHRVLRRRQRKAEYAGRNHRRLRLLPAARRGLPAGRHREVGRRRSRKLQGVATCSSTSSTKSRGWGRTSRADSSRRQVVLADSCQFSVRTQYIYRQSAIGNHNPQSAIKPSAMRSQQSVSQRSVSSKQCRIPSLQFSAIGSRNAAVSSQQSAVSSRSKANHFQHSFSALQVLSGDLVTAARMRMNPKHTFHFDNLCTTTARIPTPRNLRSLDGQRWTARVTYGVGTAMTTRTEKNATATGPHPSSIIAGTDTAGPDQSEIDEKEAEYRSERAKNAERRLRQPCACQMLPIVLQCSRNASLMHRPDEVTTRGSWRREWRYGPVPVRPRVTSSDLAASAVDASDAACARSTVCAHTRSA